MEYDMGNHKMYFLQFFKFLCLFSLRAVNKTFRQGKIFVENMKKFSRMFVDGWKFSSPDLKLFFNNFCFFVNQFFQFQKFVVLFNFSTHFLVPFSSVCKRINLIRKHFLLHAVFQHFLYLFFFSLLTQSKAWASEISSHCVEDWTKIALHYAR